MKTYFPDWKCSKHGWLGSYSSSPVQEKRDFLLRRKDQEGFYHTKGITFLGVYKEGNFIIVSQKPFLKRDVLDGITINAFHIYIIGALPLSCFLLDIKSWSCERTYIKGRTGWREDMNFTFECANQDMTI